MPAGLAPDVFLSYAREDKRFVEQRLTQALVARGKDVWIDVEDIRGGASDWRANVWAGIEAASAMVFVLTPDSLASMVCNEELEHAARLNKRIIPVLHRSVDGLQVPPALARPNWVVATDADDFERSLAVLIDALELDEAWIEQHARLTQRTREWLSHDRDGSYLLRGSDLSAAERWLDARTQHREEPTTDQVAYIGASRRAAARRQTSLLGAALVALAVTAVLALVALDQRAAAIDRERTARAQARAAEATAALSRDPEESVRKALQAVEIRPDQPEAGFALRRAVANAGWTSSLRIGRGEAALVDVEFSEAGDRVAASGEDGRVAVWDARTGRRVAALRHAGEVRTVQFSPDGDRLLTASEDGTARISDTRTGAALLVLDRGATDVWSATWGARGTVVITADDRGAQLWDARSGRRLRTLANVGEYRGTIRLSVDGRRAITAGRGGDAWLWHPETGRRLAVLRGAAQDPVIFTSLSADGRRAATVSLGGRMSVWEGRRRLLVLPGTRTGALFDAGLSRDGRRVLRADAAGVAVWNVGTGRRIALLRGGGRTRSAQFDRTGTHVVTGSEDGTARVWRLPQVRREATLEGHTADVRQARFSPDGTQVITASNDGRARIWPARSRSPVAAAWQRADSTTFSPDSRRLLVVQGARQAVWHLGTDEVTPLRGGIAAMDPSSWPCGRAAGCSPWSPDGRRVTGADAAGRAVVWDAATGRVLRRLGRSTRTVSGAAFSPDGRLVLVVDQERSRARVWRLSGRPVAEVPASRGARLLSAQFLPGPLRVLTVDLLGAVKVTDPSSGAAVAFRALPAPATVAAADDGRAVAAAAADGRVRVLSLARPRSRPRDVVAGDLNSLVFDHAGSTLAGGGPNGTTTWDLRTLASTSLPAPGGQVTGATFSPRGNLLLVSSDATARLWDRSLGRVLLELPRTPGVRADFSPDGRWIAVAGDRRLELLRCAVCASRTDLVRRARSLLPAP